MGECRFEPYYGGVLCTIHDGIAAPVLCTHAAAELEHALSQAHGVAQALERRVEGIEGDAATLRGYINTYRETPSMTHSRGTVLESRLARLEEEKARTEGQVLALMETIGRVTQDITAYLENPGSRDSDAMAAWREELLEAAGAADPPTLYVRLAQAEAACGAMREALEAVVAFKPIKWHFTHSGFMNSTQLGERDQFVKLMEKVNAALSPDAGRRYAEEVEKLARKLAP